MIITDLIVTPVQISGNPTGEGRVLKVTNGYEYDSAGNVTNKIIQQKYTVVFPMNGYEKVVVKVKGDKPVITNEQIQQKGGEVKAVLKNLTGRFYRSNSGEYVLTASADGIEVIQ